MPCQSTTSNPAPISVEANSKLHIICVAHAAFYQQLILSFNGDMSNPIGTFSGSGEGKAMTLSDGSQVLTVSTGSYTTLYAQFNYSTNGSSGPFVPALSVCSPVVIGTAPSPVITTVTSEDSADSDSNDTYLTIVDLNV